MLFRSEPFDFSTSLPDQTQLATNVGHDLLNLGDMSSAGDTGHVVFPESGQLESADGVEKRKRGEDEADEDMEPAEKWFSLGEESEGGEIAS